MTRFVQETETEIRQKVREIVNYCDIVLASDKKSEIVLEAQTLSLHWADVIYWNEAAKEVEMKAMHSMFFWHMGEMQEWNKRTLASYLIVKRDYCNAFYAESPRDGDEELMIAVRDNNVKVMQSYFDDDIEYFDVDFSMADQTWCVRAGTMQYMFPLGVIRTQMFATLQDRFNDMCDRRHNKGKDWFHTYLQVSYRNLFPGNVHYRKFIGGCTWCLDAFTECSPQVLDMGDDKIYLLNSCQVCQKRFRPSYGGIRTKSFLNGLALHNFFEGYEVSPKASLLRFSRTKRARPTRDQYGQEEERCPIPYKKQKTAESDE